MSSTVLILYIHPIHPHYLHIRIRHSVIIRPLLHLFKVPAHMVRLVIRPVPFLPLARMEREDVHVG
jgi:hypothetical protein